MSKVQFLTPEQLKQDFPEVHKIFFEIKNMTSDRKKTESLHQYLTRKNIQCWCRVCYKKRLEERNTKLL